MSCYWLLVVLALGVCAELPEVEELRNEMMNLQDQYDMEMTNMRHQYDMKMMKMKHQQDMEIADLRQQIQGKQQRTSQLTNF